MQLEMVAGPLAANVLAAAALTLTPVWMRPGTYFGVRVSSDYRRSPQAGRTRRRFMLKVWAGAAFAAMLSIAAVALGVFWPIAIGFLVQMGTAVLSFRGGWRETIPYGVEAPPVRSAHLFTRRAGVPGGPAAVVLPFVILLAASLYLLANWSAIPPRFPIHWDAHGNPNGWSDRTFTGVFGPLLIALLVLTVIGVITAVQRYAGKPAPAGSSMERRNRAILTIPIIVMWIIAIVFSIAALTPLILINGQFPIPPFVLLIIPIAGVGAGIWLAVRATADPVDIPADNTPNACWKWGEFYYNPEDASIFVERRIGIGYTFNFARWQSWLVMSFMPMLPVGILLIVRR